VRLAHYHTKNKENGLYPLSVRLPKSQDSPLAGRRLWSYCDWTQTLLCLKAAESSWTGSLYCCFVEGWCRCPSKKPH